MNDYDADKERAQAKFDMLMLKIECEKLDARRREIDIECMKLQRRLDAIDKGVAALERSKAGVYGGKL